MPDSPKHRPPPTHLLRVTPAPSLLIGDKTYPCVIGKAGFATPGGKREGDSKTPVGEYPLRAVYYRPDRLDKPQTALEITAITPDLGWCDDPAHPLYNQPVTLPFTASHERMWREDHCYDLVVVVGYNDAPALPGLGSAIFLHCPHDDGRSTAGCVAVGQDVLLAIIRDLKPGAILSMGA